MARTAARPAADTTPLPTPGLDPAGATPMMAQYIEIKAANPDCLLFYRMGDFYELFFEDAEIASPGARHRADQARQARRAARSRCAACRSTASDDYLHRLIALGHRVAVCEQTEDPAEAKKRGPKSVVRRAVVRLVTPGTITEERLLEPGRANLLLALGRAEGTGEGAVAYGLAAVDISTGALPAERGRGRRSRRRHRPARSARDRHVRGDPRRSRPWRGSGRRAARRSCPWRRPSSTRRRRAAHRASSTASRRSTGSASSPGPRSRRPARRSSTSPARSSPPGRPWQSPAREDARRHPGDRRRHPRQPRTHPHPVGGADGQPARHDRPHRRRPNGRAAAGRAPRRAAHRSRRASRRRHAAVAHLVDDGRPARPSLRDALARAPDLARALSRTGLGRAGPRDLAAHPGRPRRRGAISARASLAIPDLPADLARLAAIWPADRPGPDRDPGGGARRRSAPEPARRRLRPAGLPPRDRRGAGARRRIPAR